MVIPYAYAYIIRRGIRSGASLCLQFLRRIVLFNRLRHDGTGRVASLVVLALRGDGPRHVAGTQSERRTQRRQRRYQHGDDDLNNLLPCHTLPPSVNSRVLGRRCRRTPSTDTRAWSSCRRLCHAAPGSSVGQY